MRTSNINTNSLSDHPLDSESVNTLEIEHKESESVEEWNLPGDGKCKV
jgi:hypothetical protein